jgi:hypothetical protein
VEVYGNGFSYWPGDGFHRVEAHKLEDKKMINALVREGGEEQAAAHALRANTTHGLRRSRKDTQRCNIASRSIAKIVDCDHKTVEATRESLAVQRYE